MPRSPAQTRRMIAIASSSASTESGPERIGPPQAPIPCQNAPAPRPSSTRPPPPGPDPLPEPPRPGAAPAAPAAEPVERGGGLGEHAGVAQRQVGDVGE